jgi:hypothetical protein
MTNISKDKFYGFFVNPLSDKLFAIAGLNQDGSSVDIDWTATREEAETRRISYLMIAATLKFPGTYQGILTTTMNWLETANGRRKDDVAADNLETILDVTFEVERLVAEAGLKWEKSIGRGDVHQIAARLIADNVSLGGRNVSAETLARASFEYATIPNDVLPDDVEPFVAERVKAGQYDIRSAIMLQRFYEAVRDIADAKHGAPELASDDWSIAQEFGREMSFIERLSPDLLADRAEKSVAWRAHKAGLAEVHHAEAPAA